MGCSGRVAWLPATVALLLGTLAAPLHAQSDSAHQRRWLPLPAGQLEGWARTLGGERFSYFSAHPTLTASLLVRSLDSSNAAEWETASIPTDFSGDTVEFVWLNALDVTDPGQAPVRFFLDINGKSVLSLPQPQAVEPRCWSVPGTDGIRLGFRVLMVDRFGDVHGLMSLRVPVSHFPRGAPLRIRVRGESVNRRSWFIAFTGSVRPTLWLTSEQALLREAGGPRQSIRLDAWTLADSLPVTVRIAGRTRREVLPLGSGTVRIPATPVRRRTAVRVEVTSANGAGRAAWTGFTVDPVIPREIHLIPHSHLDIGYTDWQPNVLQRVWTGYDSAIAIAERSAGRPEGSRFRWTVEGLWPVDLLLDSGPPALRARFIAAARSGELSLTATYANAMSALARPEELDRSLDMVDSLRRLGIPVTVAQSSDVPGFAWGMVAALARRGIRYLSSGPNYQPNLPGRGDRIGHTLTEYGDRAFWWLSPSAQESVLVMVAGHGYSWFHGFGGGRATLAEADRIIAYMGELAASRYPWALVQARYTTGDNGLPDAQLPDLVRDWNRRFVSPRLVLSTQPELFAAFERRYGARLPRLRGDWTGYWEDGAGSSAQEVALSRNAAERLVQAEAVAAIRGTPVPADLVRAAWRHVFLMTEHTWGADRSISDPDLPDVRAQWEWKRAQAVGADSLSRLLLAGALPPGEPGAGGAFEVFNTSSWPRGGVVTLGWARIGDRVSGPAGPLPTQRLPDGSLAVALPAVPGLSSLRLTTEAGAAEATGRAGAAGDSLWNGELTVKVDTVTGAISSVRWQGSELVDRTGGGWGDYRYVAGYDPGQDSRVTGARLTVVAAGPLVAAIRIESDAPGAKLLVRTVRLLDGSSDVEIETVIDKRPVREKEGVHLVFPFAVAGPQVRYDQAGSVVRAELDQLPGANRNVYPVGRWADVSGPAGGVTLATVDAPLLELGGLTAEAWHHRDGTETWLRSAPRSATLVSYVMNNYWHTNFKADQDGPVRFRYVVRPHGRFDPAAAARFGLERSQPLLVAAADRDAAQRRPLPVPSDVGVLVESLRLLPGDSLVVRLSNPTPERRTVILGHRRVVLPGQGALRIVLPRP